MKFDRRNFLKGSATAGIGLALMQTPLPLLATSKIKKVKIGLIGAGLRGQLHLEEMLKRNDVEVIAMADPDKNMIEMAKKISRKYNKREPVSFSNGENDYKNLLKRNDIDAVIISSPWEWHIIQGVDALMAGKIVGMEVGGAMKLQDCWDIVNASEKMNIPVMVLENVCYRRDIMAIVNMVHVGYFGEILHFQGGYQHDLRGVLFNDGITPYDSGVEFGKKGFSEAKWRTNHYIERNCDNYPTHGLGPISTMIDINRGNRLTRLSSISTKTKGLNKYVSAHPKGGSNHPNAKVNFKQGDIVSTQIQTENGETILLSLDTSSPRPYNLGFRLQGTEGIWQEHEAGEIDKGRIYIENKSKKHTWENPKAILSKMDHPLWKKFSKDAESSGHGGMDFFVDNAFIECIKRKIEFPLDVYDLATWYAITPLSGQSILAKGQLVDIPDFTRGKWKMRKKIFGLSNEF